jgi:4-hydroxybenzoate polyprenyltransferase
MPSIAKRLNAYSEMLHINLSVNALLSIVPALMALWYGTSGRPALSQVVVLTLSLGLTFYSAHALAEFFRCMHALHHPEHRDYPCAALRDGVIRPGEALGWSIALIVISLALDATISVAAMLFQFAVCAFLCLYMFLHQYYQYHSFSFNVVLALVYGAGSPFAYLLTDDFYWFAWVDMVGTAFLIIAFMLQDSLRLAKFFPNAIADYASETMLASTAERSALSALDARPSTMATMVVCYALVLIGMTYMGFYFSFTQDYWLSLAAATLYCGWCAWRAQFVRASRGLRLNPPREFTAVILFIGVVADFYVKTGGGILWK